MRYRTPINEFEPYVHPNRHPNQSGYRGFCGIRPRRNDLGLRAPHRALRSYRYDISPQPVYSVSWESRDLGVGFDMGE